jgi:hypothetical protein
MPQSTTISSITTSIQNPSSGQKTHVTFCKKSFVLTQN